MKVRPLQDRIIIQRLEGEERSRGGIIIPDLAKEKPTQGKVIATGNGKVLDNGEVRPLTVKVGDRILFSKCGGTDFKWEGEEYLILREDEVLGILQ